jgi:hypothetical protein
MSWPGHRHDVCEDEGRRSRGSLPWQSPTIPYSNWRTPPCSALSRSDHLKSSAMRRPTKSLKPVIALGCARRRTCVGVARGCRTAEWLGGRRWRVVFGACFSPLACRKSRKSADAALSCRSGELSVCTRSPAWRFDMHWRSVAVAAPSSGTRSKNETGGCPFLQHSKLFG